MKHTKGIWIVSKKDNEGPMTIVGPVKTNKYMEYKSGVICAETFAPKLGEAEANARLISAAPEMISLLEKLKEIVDDVDAPDWRKPSSKEFEGHCLLCGLFQKKHEDDCIMPEVETTIKKAKNGE